MSAIRIAGTDTVVAYWERLGRPATVAQLGDLEVVPARTVIYRGASFVELDVEAVLDPARISRSSARPSARLAGSDESAAQRGQRPPEVPATTGGTGSQNVPFAHDRAQAPTNSS